MRARILAGTIAVALGVGLVIAIGQSGGQTKAAGDEAAIREASDAYAAAFGKGDLAVILSLWADDAEHVADDGTVTRGKAALNKQFRDGGLLDGKHKLRVQTTGLKVVGGSVAFHDGTTTLTDPDGGSDSSPFSAVWVKTDGKWLLHRVRELPSERTPAVVGREKLSDLEWLIGDWQATGPKTEVTFNARWAKNKSFMLIEQHVLIGGEELVTVVMVIGWDPIEGQLRSWMFDSNGGFGEGMWSRSGSAWIVDAAGVGADGTPAESTNVWKFVDENNFEWTAIDRELDGQPAPDISLKYTRKTAKK
jgi:uncharacterized protein (TIGR02246 family)